MELYVVEPQTLFISYLSDVLARADMDVVRIATAFDLADIERAQPGAIFVDADFLDTEPVAVVEMLRTALPAALILAYVGDETQRFGDKLSAAGANGVLSKHSGVSEIVKGIRDAVATGTFIDPRLAEALAEGEPSQDEVRYVDFRTRHAFETNS